MFCKINFITILHRELQINNKEWKKTINIKNNILTENIWGLNMGV